MFARTLYFAWIRFHQSANAAPVAPRRPSVGPVSPPTIFIPSPTIATSRPFSGSLSRSDSRCFAPFMELRSPCTRPAVLENGGLITATVGLKSFGQTALIFSAFSSVTGPRFRLRSNSARRLLNSFIRICFTPAILPQIARLAVPALVSAMMSVGRRFATHAARYENGGGVLNC